MARRRKKNWDRKIKINRYRIFSHLVVVAVIVVVVVVVVVVVIVVVVAVVVVVVVVAIVSVAVDVLLPEALGQFCEAGDQRHREQGQEKKLLFLEQEFHRGNDAI